MLEGLWWQNTQNSYRRLPRQTSHHLILKIVLPDLLMPSKSAEPVTYSWEQDKYAGVLDTFIEFHLVTELCHGDLPRWYVAVICHSDMTRASKIKDSCHSYFLEKRKKRNHHLSLICNNWWLLFIDVTFDRLLKAHEQNYGGCKSINAEILSFSFVKFPLIIHFFTSNCDLEKVICRDGSKSWNIYRQQAERPQSQFCTVGINQFIRRSQWYNFERLHTSNGEFRS